MRWPELGDSSPSIGPTYSLLLGGGLRRPNHAIYCQTCPAGCIGAALVNVTAWPHAGAPGFTTASTLALLIE